MTPPGHPPAASTPTASYRLQLTPEYGFDAAVDTFGVLVDLNISHVYLSPIAEAVPGSQHGYDVTDHSQVRSEFGGVDGLGRLMDAAEQAGLGVIIDHVPNHASVERPELNEPWWSMLRDGPTSAAARWFDVDWDLTDGRVILPKLGAPFDRVRADGGLTVGDGDRGPELKYGSLRLPLAHGTETLPLDELLDRQHYRLDHWRSGARNVRRFFTIDDLVAVCVEHSAVADVVDTIPRDLTAHPAFAGVRVDHVDGLADPASYLAGLRALLGDRLLFVEKIVAPGEHLPSSWPVDGTTGYEHIVAVEHTLLDPDAEQVLLADWHDRKGPASFHDVDRAARREVLEGGLRPDLDRTVRAIDRVDGGRDTDTAVTALTLALDRYRTYLPDEESRDVFLSTVERARGDLSGPDARDALDRVAAVITTSHSAATRWQQLTSPTMAKGVEDRAFYRWFALASLGEVGGTPDVFSTPVSAFHDGQRRRQRTVPVGMLADTTHDTKRSSGVRSRSLALAAAAERWIRARDSWIAERGQRHLELDPGIVTLALQTAVTARPLDAARLSDYLVKAAREGDVVTSWIEPDGEAEHRLAALASDLVDEDAPGPLADFATVIERTGDAIGLRVLALQLTCPGFADLYQGSPGRLVSLVDPDNRRPPEWDRLAELADRAATTDVATPLADDDIDLARCVLVRRVLGVRKRHAGAFGRSADYIELAASGAEAEHVIAFARSAEGPSATATIVVRSTGRSLDLAATSIALPDGVWRNVIDDRAPTVEGGTAQLADLVGSVGVAVLERVDS